MTPFIPFWGPFLNGHSNLQLLLLRIEVNFPILCISFVTFLDPVSLGEVLTLGLKRPCSFCCDCWEPWISHVRESNIPGKPVRGEQPCKGRPQLSQVASKAVINRPASAISAAVGRSMNKSSQDRLIPISDQKNHATQSSPNCDPKHHELNKGAVLQQTPTSYS